MWNETCSDWLCRVLLEAPIRTTSIYTLTHIFRFRYLHVLTAWQVRKEPVSSLWYWTPNFAFNMQCLNVNHVWKLLTVRALTVGKAELWFVDCRNLLGDFRCLASTFDHQKLEDHDNRRRDANRQLDWSTILTMVTYQEAIGSDTWLETEPNTTEGKENLQKWDKFKHKTSTESVSSRHLPTELQMI